MGSASEPAQAARILPGTPMRKVVPPRMVGPYMSGQRGVIAGYVHRARDVILRTPVDAFYALGLGYEGSDFKPDMAELYFLCWQAREKNASAVLRKTTSRTRCTYPAMTPRCPLM